jgi:hypothetical protein
MSMSRKVWLGLLARDAIVVFASDNGPDGPGARTFGGDMPDMGHRT